MISSAETPLFKMRNVGKWILLFAGFFIFLGLFFLYELYPSLTSVPQVAESLILLFVTLGLGLIMVVAYLLAEQHAFFENYFIWRKRSKNCRVEYSTITTYRFVWFTMPSKYHPRDNIYITTSKEQTPHQFRIIRNPKIKRLNGMYLTEFLQSKIPKDRQDTIQGN